MSTNLKNFWKQSILPVAFDKPKNATIHWQGTDSEENFRLNPTPGYTETSITYTFNTYGFREDDFDLTNNKPKILCLGCSHTEGIGLRLEDVWVTKLKQHFPSYDVYNLGWGGASADTVARLLTNSASIFKPKLVFILWPDCARYELITHPQKLTFKGSWNMKKTDLEYFDVEQLKNNFYKNKLIVDLIAEKYKFKTLELMSDDLNIEPEFRKYYEVNPSRDGHYSATQHNILVTRFMELYNAS